MSLSRMTQNMMSQQSFAGMQTAMDRVAKAQEQLTTGRLINRPSDDPTRRDDRDADPLLAVEPAAVRPQRRRRRRLAGPDRRHARHRWATRSRRARDIALQGANTGAMGRDARAALATEVDQIRDGLISSANARYLDRPIFGGITAGDGGVRRERRRPRPGVPSGTGTGVVRTVADGAADPRSTSRGRTSSASGRRLGLRRTSRICRPR